MSERVVLPSVILLFLCASMASAGETGMLYVKSDPPGAMVLVDGEERGKTPVLIRDVEAGRRAVELMLGLDRSEKQLVTVESGKVASVDMKIGGSRPASRSSPIRWRRTCTSTGTCAARRPSRSRASSRASTR